MTITSMLPASPDTSSGPGRPVLMVSQHVIAALLITVGVIRALGDDRGVALPVAAGTALLLCYVAGVTLHLVRRSAAAAKGWLILLSALWVATLVI